MGAKKLKVLHILAEIKYSGAEVMLRLAGDYLTNRGVELHALGTLKNLGDFAPILQEAHYQIHHLPVAYTPTFFGRFYKFLRQHQFDAVHIHTESNRTFLSFIAKVAGIPCIATTVHNVFGIIFKGALLKRQAIFRWIEREIFRVKFIAIGKSVADTEAKFLKNKTTLIPNWIDSTRFYPAKDEAEITEAKAAFGLGKEDIGLSIVGAFTEVKRQEDVLKAILLLKEKTDKRFVVFLVGDGRFKAHYESFVRENKIEEYVRFTGQMKEVRQVLIASDIYLMTSKFEGLPISLLEALHCGIPAIVYNTYGLVDLMHNGQNGYLIAPNHIEDLVEKILLIINDKVLHQNLSKNASKLVREEYNMEKSLEMHIDLYDVNKVLIR